MDASNITAMLLRFLKSLRIVEYVCIYTYMLWFVHILECVYVCVQISCCHHHHKFLTGHRAPDDIIALFSLCPFLGYIEEKASPLLDCLPISFVILLFMITFTSPDDVKICVDHYSLSFRCEQDIVRASPIICTEPMCHLLVLQLHKFKIMGLYSMGGEKKLDILVLECIYKC